MAAAIGALRVTLGANTAQFEQGMRRAAATARTTGASIDRSLTGASTRGTAAIGRLRTALAGLGAVAGAGAIIAMGRSALEMASNLSETSQRLGVTVEQLQVFRLAATQGGGSVEGLERSLGIFNRTLGQARAGVPAAAQAFRALKIDPNQFMRGGDAFGPVIDKIRQLRSVSEQAAIGQRFFGRGFAELIPMVQEGSAGLERYRQQLLRTGLITEEQARKADEAMDALGRLSTMIQYRLAGALVDIIPNVEAVISVFGFLADRVGDVINRINQLSGMNFSFSNFSIPGLGPGYGLLASAARSTISRGSEGETRFQIGGMAMGFGGSRRRPDGSIQNADGSVTIPIGPYADTTPQLNLRTGGGGRRGGGRSGADDAERRRKEALRDAHEHDQELRRLRIDELQALQQQTEDAERRLNLAEQIADEEEQQWRKDIDLKLALKEITQARYDELIALRAGLALTLEAGREQERRVMIEERTNALAEQRYELAAESLRNQSAMADTAAERRRIELQLLELTQEERRRKLLQIVSDSQRRLEIAQQAEAGSSIGAYAGSAAGRRDRAAIDRAREELLGLRARDEQERAGVMSNTRGPIESYLNSLPTTALRVNEALQSIAAEGLSSITDGLADAIMMTRSWGDVFKNVARQIISDLLKIQLQRSIIGPLTNALSGLLGGPVQSSSWAQVVSTVAALPGRAAGGPVIPGHTYLVGEKGPEILRMGSMGGQVISNDNIGGGGVVVNQHFAPNFAGNAATKQEMLQLAAMVKPMAKEAYRDLVRRRG